MAQLRQYRNWFSVGKIAEYCLVSRGTAWRWIKNDKVSAVRLPSGHYRVSIEDFIDFLKRYDMPIKEELFIRIGKEKKGRQIIYEVDRNAQGVLSPEYEERE